MYFNNKYALKHTGLSSLFFASPFQRKPSFWCYGLLPLPFCPLKSYYAQHQPFEILAFLMGDAHRMIGRL
jgi:hypothetical protein